MCEIYCILIIHLTFIHIILYIFKLSYFEALGIESLLYGEHKDATCASKKSNNNNNTLKYSNIIQTPPTNDVYLMTNLYYLCVYGPLTHSSKSLGTHNSNKVLKYGLTYRKYGEIGVH